MSQVRRENVEPSTLLAPKAPAHALPRESVICSRDGHRRQGRVIGHTLKGEQLVHVEVTGRQVCYRPQDVRAAARGERLPRAFDLIDSSHILRATESEIEAFDRCLRQKVGRDCLLNDIIDEFRERGHEIYIVGGATRDTLCDKRPKDIDLTGTMPLAEAHEMLRSFGTWPNSLDVKRQQSGHLKFGLKGSQVDYCVFIHSDRYTKYVLFDADFKLDAVQRDFTCNCIYYDAQNKVLIDPLGGIDSCEKKMLVQAWDPERVSWYNVGRIVIRCIKMMLVGFTPVPELVDTIKGVGVHGLDVMSPPIVANFVRNTILPYRADARMHEAINTLGLDEYWSAQIAPLLGGVKG